MGRVAIFPGCQQGFQLVYGLQYIRVGGLAQETGIALVKGYQILLRGQGGIAEFLHIEHDGLVAGPVCPGGTSMQHAGHNDHSAACRHGKLPFPQAQEQFPPAHMEDFHPLMPVHGKTGLPW